MTTREDTVRNARLQYTNDLTVGSLKEFPGRKGRAILSSVYNLGCCVSMETVIAHARMTAWNRPLTLNFALEETRA